MRGGAAEGRRGRAGEAAVPTRCFLSILHTPGGMSTRRAPSLATAAASWGLARQRSSGSSASSGATQKPPPAGVHSTGCCLTRWYSCSTTTCQGCCACAEGHSRWYAAVLPSSAAALLRASA
jgi:hypothetical protein